MIEKTKAGIEQRSRGQAHRAVSTRVTIENGSQVCSLSPEHCAVVTFSGCFCTTTYRRSAYISMIYS